MPDETSGQSPAGKPDDQSLTNPSAVQPPQRAVMANKGTSDSNLASENPKQLAAELHWVHRATFWLQLGLGLIGIVALVIYYCQLSEMRHTNELTKQALSGSDKTLQATLSKMQLQADAMNRLADKAGIQVDKLDASVQQASRLAKATEVADRLAGDQFTREQRPFVLVSQIDNLTVQAGSQVALNVMTNNFGRSPALRKVSYDHIFIGEIPLREADRYLAEEPTIPPDNPNAIGAIPPNNTPCLPPSNGNGTIFTCTFITSRSNEVVATKERANWLMTHDQAIVAVGRIFYKDMAGNDYITEYCFYRLSNGAMAFCNRHNDVK